MNGASPAGPSTLSSIIPSPFVLECDVVYRWYNPQVAKQENVANRQRYRDNGELRYSLRSFATVEGIRYFHIVSKGPPALWLNVSHARIFYWNETRLLEEIRLDLRITQPLNVANSEPAKLAIADVDHARDRLPAVAKFAQRADDLKRAIRVEAGGRLVEEEKAWAVDELYRNSDAPPLPAAQAAGDVVANARVGNVE